MDRTDDHYPALQSRRSGNIDAPLEEARRVLLRAYQHGALSEEEFAITLDRLEYIGPMPEPVGSAQERSEIDQGVEARGTTGPF